MKLHTVEEIVDDIRDGKMVILMDDEDRENEGDIIMAAEKVRAEDINFMATYARGLICLTLTEDRCKQLALPLMVHENHALHNTNFTVSIEAAEGVTTGISAADRAQTVLAAVKKDASPRDLVQPGHIFPVMAQQGGVLNRAGHTEAGCDLAQLAGYTPAAVIVEVMNEDGTMARRPDLEMFAEKYNLKIGTISDLIQYRAIHEKTLRCMNERKVQTEYGDFLLKSYFDSARSEYHYALIRGEVRADKPMLVRVHVGSTVRDVLTVQNIKREDKAWNFQAAMKRVDQEGAGVLVLICHNETTREVEESIDWLLSGKQSRPTADIVYKQIGTGSQILQDLGVRKMRLMSAPFKFKAISGFNLEVVEYVTDPALPEQLDNNERISK